MQSFKEEAGLAVKEFIDNYTAYLEEIIVAVESFKSHSKERPAQVDISAIDYKPRTRPYLSQVVDKARAANPERYNSQFKEYFKFELMKDDRRLLAAV